MDSLTFACLSLDADTLLIGEGDYKRFSTPPSHIETALFYFPDFFFEEPQPWWQFEKTTTLTRKLFQSSLSPLANPSYSWSTPSKELFIDAMTTVQTGQLQKVVPYCFTRASATPPCPKTILFHALQAPGSAYALWTPDGGICGATPELLLHSDDLLRWQTMALAGTMTDLMEANNDKLQREHAFVVEDIEKRLKEPLQISSQKRQSYGKLYHLCTPIAFESRQDPMVLLQKLHPTAALGTYPANTSWLRRCAQKEPRGRFGAPVGVFWRKKTLFKSYVAIRNVEWNSQTMRIGAGCGIVAESELSLEWEEALCKIASIRHFLHL